MADNCPINMLLANRDLVITYANPASIEKLKTLEKYLPCRAEEVVARQSTSSTRTRKSNDACWPAIGTCRTAP